MLMITNAVVRLWSLVLYSFPVSFSIDIPDYEQEKKKKEVKDEQAVKRKSQFFLSFFFF